MEIYRMNEYLYSVIADGLSNAVTQHIDDVCSL